MSSWDQGNALPAALGTAITAAYNASTTSAALFGFGAQQVDVFLNMTTVGGSPITQVVFKIQGQDRDGAWYDVESKREDTGAKAVEHTFVLGAAPQSAQKMITCIDEHGALACRVRTHADAIGVAGDVIIGNVTFS